MTNPETNDVEEVTAEEAELIEEQARSVAIEPAFGAIQSGEPSLVAQLQKMDDAALIFQRRCDLLETCQTAAIRATRPEDWVLSKPKDSDEVTGMLCSPGAQVVAPYYGIVVDNLRPVGPQGDFAPKEKRGPDGELSLTGWCDAYSQVTGRTMEAIEGSRSSSEDFTGRSDFTGASKLVQYNDLRTSVYTLLHTKAVRILAGLSRVPLATLEAAWKGTDKKTDNCRKGTGFGGASGRRASSVSNVDGDAKQKLKDEVLRRVGGDVHDAKKLTKEITSNPNPGPGKRPFAGFDDLDRCTQDWQIERAWKNLDAHPVFGKDGG